MSAVVGALNCNYTGSYPVPCPNRQELVAVDDRVAVDQIAGWQYTDDTGWLCPTHAINYGKNLYWNY